MSRDLTPDHILRDTLAVQNQAHTSFVRAKPELAEHNGGLMLTVLGCGTMGIAILGGILDSLSSSSQNEEASEETPKKLPTRFSACVRRHESAERIRKELCGYSYFKNVTIYEKENLLPVQQADVILLGCKPHMVKDVLEANGIQEALAGKVLISICAGVTEQQIASSFRATPDVAPCKVVRAMPNTAAAVRESMTVIATSNPPLPAETNSLITWIFSRIGRTVNLPSNLMDVSTALCGSGPAFAALILESLVAGAIAMGLPRDDAYVMAAQTMRGTTGLVLGGEHPAILRDKVSTPGGCTIGGLLVLEEGMVRGTVSRAVREATVVASQLGQGKGGVNGTRKI
nr:pyrroline-5-carboxylate reductase [Quercus suber]